MFSRLWNNSDCGSRLRNLVVLAVLVAVTACTKGPAQLVESAKGREAKGDLTAAIIDLKSAIQQQPNDATTRFMLGRLYNETFDYASAEKELGKARELGSVEGGRTLAELGRSLRGLGKLKELIEQVVPSSAYEPAQMAIIYSLRGRAHLMLGNSEKARSDLVEAQRLAPGLVDVQLFDAQLRVAASDVAGAESIVDAVLHKSPKNFEALSYKGRLLRDQRKFDDAIAVYSRMLEINPSHFQALTHRATLSIGLGRLDAAKKDVDRFARAYKGHPQSHILRGMVQLAENKPRDALETAQLALKVQPAPASADLLAGVAYLMTGAPLQAELSLSKYVAKVPGSTLGRRGLAEALIRGNQGARALEVLSPLLQGREPDPSAYALAAQASAQAGKTSQAAQFYEKAATLAPQNPRYRVRQAMFRMDSGEYERGLEELGGAVETLKSATDADEILVLANLSKKRFDEAMKAVESLERRVPNSPIAANLRGTVLLAKGNRKEAVAAFDKALELNPGFFPAASNLARLDLAARNPDAARKRYDGVLQANENHLAALLAAADFDALRGNLKSSVGLLRRAVKAHPKVIDPWIRLATAYVAMNDLHSAAQTVDEALATHSDEPVVLVLVANVQMRAGNVNQALQALSRLVQVSPTPQAYLELARAQGWANSDREAEKSLRKALQLRKDFGPAQIALSGFLSERRRIDEALKFARTIQADQPKAAIGFVLESEIRERERRWGDALTALRAALQREPVGLIASSIYRVRVKSGAVKEALAELEQWSAKHPNDRVGQLSAAYAHIEAGDAKEAVRRYETMTKENPRDSDVLNGLAWAYYLTGDERALRTAEAAYALAPLSAHAQDTLGWILAQKGDVVRGLGLLRVANKTLPNNPDIRFHLAAALHKAGDHAAARKELQALLANGTEFSSVGEARALLTSLR